MTGMSLSLSSSVDNLLKAIHFSTSTSLFIQFKAMEETKFFRYGGFLMILMVHFLSLKGVAPEVYVVGDEEEWNADADFDLWSQKYKFSTGDVLRFKYLKGQHNAYEVTEATYRSCDASSGVLARYESGDDQVKLTKAKNYWFICNIPGHCLGGMRFTIDVKEASTTSEANVTDAASSTQMKPSPPVNSCKRNAPLWWSMGIRMVVFGILPRLEF